MSDGPAESETYTRRVSRPGARLHAPRLSCHPLWANCRPASRARSRRANRYPAVTIAVAKQKGTNAVSVAKAVLKRSGGIRKREILPHDVELVVTRNYGQTANEKVNELVESLAVAIVIVLALLTLRLGWREGFIVAVAVPVVFGLTLAVNLLFGFTINRVTLFALILSLGLLVDDPIVDVENIARHFAVQEGHTPDRAGGRGRDSPAADHGDVGRDRLVSADVLHHRHDGAVHAPMALNVPVTMLMSMLVASPSRRGWRSICCSANTAGAVRRAMRRTIRTTWTR